MTKTTTFMSDVLREGDREQRWKEESFGLCGLRDERQWGEGKLAGREEQWNLQ